VEADSCDSVVTPPLPMDAVFFSHSQSERRVMYEYVVQAGRATAPSNKPAMDPDLYRDDLAVLKGYLHHTVVLFVILVGVMAAKLKSQAEQAGPSDSKSYRQLLREKRDYKRRRQKYRAKNSHITRRKTSEVSCYVNYHPMC